MLRQIRIITVSTALLSASQVSAQFAPGPRLDLLPESPPSEEHSESVAPENSVPEAELPTLDAEAEQAAPTPLLQPDQELQLRALMLEENLCSLQRPMRIYTYSWISGLSAVLVAQGVLALMTRDANTEGQRATRAGLLVSMSMTTSGIAALALMPKPEIRACDHYRALEADPTVTLRERVVFGETQLAQSERAVRRQTSWWMHGLATTLGAAVGTGLGLGFSDNALRATVQGIGTVAMTEARVLTRPTRARRFFREYRALRWAPPSATFGPAVAAAPDEMSELRGAPAAPNSLTRPPSDS